MDNKRTVQFVDPYVLFVDERQRDTPTPLSLIVKMAKSLLENGQMRPARVMLDPNNRMICVNGTMARAARLIVSGFVDEDGERHREPEYKLAVMQVMYTNDYNMMEVLSRG